MFTNILFKKQNVMHFVMKRGRVQIRLKKNSTTKICLWMLEKCQMFVGLRRGESQSKPYPNKPNPNCYNDT